MKRFVTIAAMAAAVSITALPANAAKKHHRHYYPRQGTQAYASQPQIACTVTGCIPIPRGCHPEMGYTPHGTPSGFDVAVCGNTTLYGIRR
jgi:hypothetical protein